MKLTPDTSERINALCGSGRGKWMKEDRDRGDAASRCDWAGISMGVMGNTRMNRYHVANTIHRCYMGRGPEIALAGRHLALKLSNHFPELFI